MMRNKLSLNEVISRVVAVLLVWVLVELQQVFSNKQVDPEQKP